MYIAVKECKRFVTTRKEIEAFIQVLIGEWQCLQIQIIALKEKYGFVFACP